MPNDILRNVRSSHQSLEPPLAVPVSYGGHQRALSNHRNDALSYQRQLIGSRQEKSNLAHIQRMRQHQLKQEALNADTENRYKHLYEPEYSPERYNRKHALLSNNRQSVNVHKLPTKPAAIEYELNHNNNYKPSAAAL
jgi:hypothetical protein